MFNLDQSIAAWRQQMAACGLSTPDVLNELESHLREEVDQLMHSGLSAPEAWSIAVQRLGAAAALAPEFAKAERAKPAPFRKRLASGLGMAAAWCFALLSVGCMVMLPFALRANLAYAQWLGAQGFPPPPAFLFRFVIGLAIGLAIPAGLFGLARTGRLNPQRVASLRPYLLVVNFLLAAGMSRHEVTIQLMVFLPLQFLCEACIWLTRRGSRQPVEG